MASSEAVYLSLGVPPHYVRSLEDYWTWAELVLAHSGGWLEDDFLRVRPQEDEYGGPWTGLVIERQRVHFPDRSFLEVHIVVDRDLVAVEYAFHYQAADGSLIWRKDKHPGHEELGGPEHIHPDSHDPNRAKAFKEVDLEEALGQVQDRLANIS